MGYSFRWIAWNRAKVDKHGLTPGDVEFVVNQARKPYPDANGAKHVVKGATAPGEWN